MAWLLCCMVVLTHCIRLPRTTFPRRDHSALVEDILEHEAFQQLKLYRHHTGSIYTHARRVSYLAYRISLFLGLDVVSTARGGLLHDFFLYDWRQRKMHDAKRSLHGKEHPLIALNNAKTYFSVNHIEQDIIAKHMLPKTIALPRYAESYVVSLSDKLAAVYEYLVRA